MAVPPDDLLMAYADGELDDAARRELDAILAANPEARERLAIFMETRRGAFAGLFRWALDEPVPPAILAAIEAAPVPEGGVRRQGRRSKEHRPFWETFSWPAALAQAFALVLACSAGWYVRGLSAPEDRAVFALTQEGVTAGGGLALALETGPGSAAPAPLAGSPGWAVRPILTFASRSGAYCREYEALSSTASGFHGLACRGADGLWYTLALAPRGAAPGRKQAFRPAAGPPGKPGAKPHEAHGAPPGIETLADSLIAGDPLSPAEEEALLKSGWRGSPPLPSGSR